MPMSMTATNMMYSGAVINSGSHTSFPSQVDMTCQAINSTYYLCKIVEKSEVPNDIGMGLFALVCGFIMFVVAVIICKHEGWI